MRLIFTSHEHSYKSYSGTEILGEGNLQREVNGETNSLENLCGVANVLRVVEVTSLQFDDTSGVFPGIS